ncbi:hypothetical protein RCL1_003833 [Eukaryota sp. TZLM3-RCL]
MNAIIQPLTDLANKPAVVIPPSSAFLNQNTANLSEVPEHSLPLPPTRSISYTKLLKGLRKERHAVRDLQYSVREQALNVHNHVDILSYLLKNS